MRLLIRIALLCLVSSQALAHQITYCSEVIPVDNDFVANKLMGTIRAQIPTATLATLRRKAKIYFPYISARLRAYGLPDDLKYIPIVECGFRNLVSGAGARGFWQIMPDVAKNMGMIVTPTYDERDYPVKATEVACKLLRENYQNLRSQLGVSSWVLAAAAYNFGAGNIRKTVRKQGQSDYFRMQLNDETAAYVYKLIAIKELFERPERYMRGFNTNIFKEGAGDENEDVNTLAQGPAKTESVPELGAIEVVKEETPAVQTKIVYVAAQLVVEDGKKFKDGGMVKVQLKSDLQLPSAYTGKGMTLLGHGWIIDDRVLIDLGYDEVEVLDTRRTKGVTKQEAANNGQYVLLKAEVPVD